MKKVGGSFRDPSGYVYNDGQRIIRTITEFYKETWECIGQNGLLKSLLENGKIIPFKEESLLGVPEDAWKCLSPERIPFISYPYEWSFSQLKDAALLTLDIQKEALHHGVTLKDASAFNVQFVGSKAFFIDLLSFDLRAEGSPWQAYRQFCMHFLAPLALQKFDLKLGKLSSLWIDGLPLGTACAMLPWRTNLSLGLQMHLHTHARMEKKYSDGRVSHKKVRATRISRDSLLALIESLEGCVKSLSLPKIKTEWGEYYTDTNYTCEADAVKVELVEKIAQCCSSESTKRLAVDLGANTGKYSSILSKYYDYVVAADIDPLAVEKHYLQLKEKGNRNILPLIIDLTNPSPAIGWSLKERMSLLERCKADFVTALAIVHHLRLTFGIPFSEQAAFFAKLTEENGFFLAEFVPRSDSQVQRLLAARDDVFQDFELDSFCSAYSSYFTEESRTEVTGSGRTMILFKRNSRSVER